MFSFSWMHGFLIHPWVSAVDSSTCVKSPRLIVVSGPSGVGKTTLCDALLQDPRLVASVSCTTRPTRPGETDGRDYVFLSRPEFDRRIAAGSFLEHAEVHGNRYGTPREPVEAALRAGRCPLLDIDVQGADQVRTRGIPAAYLFVAPRDLAVLRERLRRRHTESDAEIARRLATAEREMEAAPRYDRLFVNDERETTILEMRAYLDKRIFSVDSRI